MAKSRWLRIQSVNHVFALTLTLEQLLDECSEEGWSSRLVAPHCYVECVDFKKLGPWKDEGPKMKQAREGFTAKWNQDKMSVGDSMDIITFSPNLAPFSIFPFDDRTCVELVIGAKSFTTFLNIEGVLRQFEDQGWTVESSMNDAIAQTNGEAIAIVKKKGGFFCHIPPADFGKLLFEMLSPSTLVQECEYIRSRDPRLAGGYGIWTLDGEASQWN